MYILSGKKITAVYPMSRRRWDQNTTQVDYRLEGKGYIRTVAPYFLHGRNTFTTDILRERVGAGGTAQSTPDLTD